MECPICLESYSRFLSQPTCPTIVPCKGKHTFCSSCILKLFGNGEQPVSCPLCRQEMGDLTSSVRPNMDILYDLFSDELVDILRPNNSVIDKFKKLAADHEIASVSESQPDLDAKHQDSKDDISVQDPKPTDQIISEMLQLSRVEDKEKSVVKKTKKKKKRNKHKEYAGSSVFMPRFGSSYVDVVCLDGISFL
jgi:hypothetical protein